MRLHRLELTAFGPFAGRHVLDVDALADAGLFLLHGDTGAGKTTLLDAVSFALFGTVPGARPGGEGLRSHYAAPDVATEVRLEVTVGGRRLRLTRRPRQERPKKRGSGTTTAPASATLEAHDGTGWRARSTRLDEIGHEVEAALGMGAEQFHQVVLLPQGDFARFLRADAEARRPLLEKLFGTGRFADVEAWLDDHRRGLAAEVRDGEEALGRALALVRGTLHQAITAGHLHDDALADQLDGASLPPADVAVAWAEGHLDALQRRLADEQRRLDAAQRAQRRAGAAHDAALELAERQRRHRDATSALARLDTEADTIATRSDELAAARRAATVMPVAQALEQRRRAVDDGRHALAAARQRLAHHEPGLAEADAPALRRSAAALAGELVNLDRLREVDGERRRLREAVAALADAVTAADAELSRLDAERDELPGRVDAARAAVTAAERAAEAAARLRHDEQVAAERLAAARRRQSCAEALTHADEARRRAVDHHQRRVEHHLDLVHRRLDGLAVELAARLVEGESCPVCGSVEHPAPAIAELGGGPPTAEQVESAAAEARAAQRAREAAEAAEAERRAELAAASALAGDASPDELSAAHDSIVDRRRQADAEAAGVDDARRSLRHLEARYDELDDLRRRLTERRAVAAAEADAKERRALDLDRELVTALGEDGDLDRRRRAVVATAAAVEAALDAATALDAALDEASRADQRARDVAVDADFDDVAAAVDAVRDDTELAELARQVAAHDRARAAALEALSSPDVRAAAEADEARPDVTEAARHDAEAQLARQQATTAVLDALVVELAHRVEGVRHAVEALGPQQRQLATVAGLADLVTGRSDDNALRMRLSTFVLAARLEQVAAAASERLARMSAGRYTLAHTDEEGDGRKRGGLGLRVLDAWSGTERHPATLSGGETFFASLALALGLADVVCAEAGGARIDTLFIDEGFGSLDESTLAEVMDVLDELRGGGRCVGIVSHVADLRTRIPTHVEVRKARDGSTVHQPSAA